MDKLVMISIEQYRKRVVDLSPGLEAEWDTASALAVSYITELPDIGFRSQQKRISAFSVILGQVHEAIAAEEVTQYQVHLAITIARFSDRKFEKAFDAFERKVRSGSIDHIDPASRSRLTAFLFHIGG